MNTETAAVRVDKWLWAARFFKTRSLAQKAVEGGRVKLNGCRVKPAKELRAGDLLQIHVGELEWLVTVRALAERRGSAEAACLLYEESAESAARRQAQLEQRRMQVNPAATLRGRPTKRDRRRLERWTQGD